MEIERNFEDIKLLLFILSFFTFILAFVMPIMTITEQLPGSGKSFEIFAHRIWETATPAEQDLRINGLSLPVPYFVLGMAIAVVGILISNRDQIRPRITIILLYLVAILQVWLLYQITAFSSTETANILRLDPNAVEVFYHLPYNAIIVMMMTNLTAASLFLFRKSKK